ncbi:nitroreductase [Mycolicibacterium sp. BK556]|uniref:nitroreductase n=1 Tax=Mycobacteriaceae TaxID=1762 RepID=UPI00105C1881|nr:nitroreductase [Mycobacterium sp. BK086]MBB3601148.1 nitroreductase [Mycolicibacterium sp. BK556]MBB3630901.1 nitroreductase [Mycolicibacterium sp. BK607]MBB3748902.1 nitroreductase [Mycolicibacterium sp. BK634]TDO14886.1 nitroreductase [Mycobacterium sp. BK086]
MHDLEEAITGRRSIRLFLRDRPVPRELVTESLQLAIRAPSNSNVQPWHVVFASGPARDRLAEALLEQADIAAPNVPELPKSFAHLRRELGALVYGTMGIARDDAEARRLAVLRNWEFFRAPLTGIVCMHRDLDYVDAVGVGMFLQTFLLALTARGLGSCVQVSVAGYPDVLREHLGIGEDMRILCGVSIGYPDPEFACNQLTVPRNPLEANVVFKES